MLRFQTTKTESGVLILNTTTSGNGLFHKALETVFTYIKMLGK